MSTWPIKTIGQLIEEGAILVHKDGNHGANYPRVSEFVDDGLPFLTAKSISDWKLDIEGAPRLSEAKAATFKFGFIQPDDVLLSHNATVGRVALVPEFEGKAVIGTSLTHFRLNKEKLNPRFLAVCFMGRDFQNQLSFGMTQTTRNQVPITAQRHLPVTVPPIELQNEIADRAFSILDKIELNRRMNETLEEMARALFRDWFVDFGPTRRQIEGATDPSAIMGHAFPPEKAATLAPLFPSKLGDDGLPEGWEHCELSDFCKIKSGKRPPLKSDKQTKENSVPVWGGNGIGWYTNQTLFDEKLIVTGRVGTLGTVYRVPKDVWISDNALCVFPHDEKFEFLFQSMRTFDYSSLNSGSTQPLITQTALKKQVCVNPGKNLFFHFEGLASSFTYKIQANEQENQTLAEMRDLLLPKLMSGEIRLKDAEVPS